MYPKVHSHGSSKSNEVGSDDSNLNTLKELENIFF